MRLIYDDVDEVYIWVEYHDHDIELSPRFDDKNQANNWYKFMKTYFRSAT